jgi:hypothetical protein
VLPGYGAYGFSAGASSILPNGGIGAVVDVRVLVGNQDATPSTANTARVGPAQLKADAEDLRGVVTSADATTPQRSST